MQFHGLPEKLFRMTISRLKMEKMMPRKMMMRKKMMTTMTMMIAMACQRERYRPLSVGKYLAEFSLNTSFFAEGD